MVVKVQWSSVGLTVESVIMHTNQDRSKEWEYCVIAVNKAGEGESCNTVMGVL
jgi:hypothetical protein